MARRIGVRYTEQRLDLEKRLKLFFERLEAYATLTVQPINYQKTEALWPARALGPPDSIFFPASTKLIGLRHLSI
ncbi:unnamed protein product [Didymodactylos carnosus]|uniref:Uncharacterized protein n=1 Tax=Didymodactylos carnosus TaxID=1234261 RepID=A0A814J0B0_9BILA|nr:unnamed protein product [Didymodactylos carnosus]CAF3802175.1 unnamed protein product [Didymodactylos carnosus]